MTKPVEEAFELLSKAFSKSLYKVDDVVDVNSQVLENLAIRDGYYDPYAEDLTVSSESNGDVDESNSRL